MVQGPSFAAGDRFPEDLRVGVANAEGARRPFLPTLRLRARSKPPLAAADGRTSTAQPGVLKPWEFQFATNKVISVAAAREIFARGNYHEPILLSAG